MAGLYQRSVAPNIVSPAMQVAASPGAGGAVPRGAGLSQQQVEQGIDAARLGGLLGMIRNGAGNGSRGVFNASVMPGAGQGLTSPVTTQAADTAAMLRGNNVDVASRMAEGAANLPLPTMADKAGLSAPGMNADISGLTLNFDPSRRGLLGAFGFGG